MNTPQAHRHINNLVLGFLTSKSIQLAGELGVADQLVEGPLHVDDIARRTNTKSDRLYRILRLLAANGVFEEEPGRQFSLNPAGELLRSDVRSSFNAFAKIVGDYDWRPAEHLDAAVRDGDVPFNVYYHEPAFDYIGKRPELVALFNDAMLGYNWPGTEAILDSCDFAGVETFADIGGGNGHVVINVLKKHPEVKGVLFDLEHVVKQSKLDVEESGVSERCAIVPGSFFEDIPVESDTYFLRHILHDWNDEECVTILNNIARVANRGARIMIAECVIGEPNAGITGPLLDVLMMVALTGRERTAGEYGDLLRAAGFEHTGTTPTDSLISVVEGRRT